jgi:hypothetical protein
MSGCVRPKRTVTSSFAPNVPGDGAFVVVDGLDEDQVLVEVHAAMDTVGGDAGSLGRRVHVERRRAECLGDAPARLVA